MAFMHTREKKKNVLEEGLRGVEFISEVKPYALDVTPPFPGISGGMAIVAATATTTATAMSWNVGRNFEGNGFTKRDG